MKKFTSLILIPLGFACVFTSTDKQQAPAQTIQPEQNPERKIGLTLDKWHAAAANASFDEYFDLMTEDGIFIGTDATENWQNKEFREFARPYFDKGKAWSFSTLERNIYTSKNGETAWFDELLNTQMAICRGSGVLENMNGDWKIKHYVLSIAIPNEHVSEITELKKASDSILISNLQTRSPH